MKILIFRETELKELNPDVMNRTGLAGTENSVVCLAEELSKFHIVKVCCPTVSKFFNKVEYINFRSYAEVFLICSLFEPDVLIVSGNPNILFRQKLPVKRIIFWQQNHPHELSGRFNIKELLFQIEKIDIVAPSPEAALYYQDYYKEKQRIQGIYNGVRKEFYNIKKNIEKDRVIYVGSFSAAKGLDVLLKAIKNLPELNFTLCGSFSLYGFTDSNYEDCCKFMLKDLKNVTLAGSLNAEELAKELSFAELCIVNPNIYNKETCCVSALEAMATGTPVLAGRSEILDKLLHDHAGQAVYLENNELNKAISELILDKWKDSRVKMSTCGKEFTKDLSWDKIVLKWNKLLEIKNG